MHSTGIASFAITRRIELPPTPWQGAVQKPLHYVTKFFACLLIVSYPTPYFWDRLRKEPSLESQAFAALSARFLWFFRWFVFLAKLKVRYLFFLLSWRTYMDLFLSWRLLPFSPKLSTPRLVCDALCMSVRRGLFLQKGWEALLRHLYRSFDTILLECVLQFC